MAATETLPARPLADTDEALLVAQIEFTRWTAVRASENRIFTALPCSPHGVRLSYCIIFVVVCLITSPYFGRDLPRKLSTAG